ncbi:MAG: hypothetical protein A2Z16_10315 [Chloroflexi bacterium RBG_16_54_18]|nr:MAG: hypothetical protein A2Z16_10315 [Chloroflexi bacterium RBG_16_54_18]
MVANTANTGVSGCQTLAPSQLWSASQELSSRIKRLRDQFWSFYEREYTNEVRGYTTGTEWDTVYSIWSWTNVPEVALFQKGFRSYLLAGAARVELPAGFWEEALIVRQALFFREVVSRSRNSRWGSRKCKEVGYDSYRSSAGAG